MVCWKDFRLTGLVSCTLYPVANCSLIEIMVGFDNMVFRKGLSLDIYIQRLKDIFIRLIRIHDLIHHHLVLSFINPGVCSKEWTHIQIKLCKTPEWIKTDRNGYITTVLWLQGQEDSKYPCKVEDKKVEHCFGLRVRYETGKGSVKVYNFKWNWVKSVVFNEIQKSTAFSDLFLIPFEPLTLSWSCTKNTLLSMFAYWLAPQG